MGPVTEIQDTTMPPAPSLPHILVICDHPRLARIIALNLEPFWKVGQLVVEETAEVSPLQIPLDLRLVILGLSSSEGEPLVTLHRAVSTPIAGKIPLLIVSDRAFVSRASELIWHLDYPFDSPALCLKVRDILSEATHDES